ncbi:hypothetical protein CSUI_005097 [Cystoisospora suis]|uniref:Uncharacterized protein n=1 Tax=Cystoisospora suis TaxID=483139 RepID=A0A2C6K864_9APIC|nr:hypothetical protein CSUI_005097 [Cystoisospora suis]
MPGASQLDAPRIPRVIKVNRPGSAREVLPQYNTSSCNTAKTTKEACGSSGIQDKHRTSHQTDVSSKMQVECGFKYQGPEPTMHGDWAHKGRVTDF